MNEDDRFLFLDLKLMERLEENQENQDYSAPYVGLPFKRRIFSDGSLGWVN